MWLSDAGILAMLALLAAWARAYGVAHVAALYLGPLAVTNVWLVLYTWLQHTDVDVPHLGPAGFSFIRGAFLSIDRRECPPPSAGNLNLTLTFVRRALIPSIHRCSSRPVTPSGRRQALRPAAQPAAPQHRLHARGAPHRPPHPPLPRRRGHRRGAPPPRRRRRPRRRGGDGHAEGPRVRERRACCP